MKVINTFIQARLNTRKNTNSLRQLSVNNALIDFSSNDYLGFSHSPELKTIYFEALKNHPHYPLGSTGSRLLSGNNDFIEALENEIAAFHLAQSALIFNSGYDANLGLISSLAQRNDTIISDELIHASMIDGARLSYAKRYTFKHNDLDSLHQKLKLATGNIYILVESIYSMDGDEAPLKEICDLADRYQAAVIVDEAHAVGVFGNNGRGLVEDKELTDRVFARIITFGKALGTHGAAILGSNALRLYLINFARSFIYTTAASFSSNLAIKTAYQFLNQYNHQQLIHQRINYFKTLVSSDRLIESKSPIQVLCISGNKEAREAGNTLKRLGFDIRPILSPTVKEGAERLRICLHNHNSLAEIEELAFNLNKI